MLFYDPISKQYFESEDERLREQYNKLKEILKDYEKGVKEGVEQTLYKKRG